MVGGGGLVRRIRARNPILQRRSVQARCGYQVAAGDPVDRRVGVTGDLESGHVEVSEVQKACWSGVKQEHVLG